MSQSERRHFSGEEKVKILRLHLLEGKAVSDLCEQFKINPSLFYQWQRSFFENGARAFEGSGPARSESKLEKQVEALEARLQRKHEGLSELMEEHIRLKKILGSSECGMDRPRHPGRVDRLRATLVGADRDLLRAVAAVDSTVLAQIPGLARPLWQSQPAQSPGSERTL